MAKRPTEGTEADRQVQELCNQARRVSRVCELLGFERTGVDRLVTHLEGYVLEDRAPLTGHADAVQVLEDPDLRPYIWDLED